MGERGASGRDRKETRFLTFSVGNTGRLGNTSRFFSTAPRLKTFHHDVPLRHNVLLDVLLNRTHAEDGLFLLDEARKGGVKGAVTPTVLTNTFCVGRGTAGRDVATDFIESALSFLDVASVSHAGAVRAVRRYDDFEGGIIGEAAAEYGIDVICTRNVGDFGPARPQVLTPKELRSLLGT